ncbi:Abi family protein [uncultured Phascolarctobacterium sp.]|uniref:Abi family protein n=1 Tax=uncultured Phascolarctobacterium sp. TaxID=512296 RepID=UPI002613D500|nr:Abi family protein [uncultured Phascolarctobacterium sp.]
MDKPFKTYRQQLSILRNRNLIINNGSKATKLLKANGYYNIINGYKDIFIDSTLTQQYNDDRYKAGTTFENIYALYDFDRNMRAILIKYILKMETSLKTKVAYHFSNAYKSDFNYLDINNFDGSNPQSTARLINDLTNVIKKNTTSDQQGARFYHYLDKHKELPLWVLVTKMTFGNIIHFYNGMKMSEKLAVIKEIVTAFEKAYNKKITISLSEQESFISNMFSVINILRNACAHEERLYNIVCKTSRKIPRISLFHQTNPVNFQSHLFDGIVILGLFLNKKEYLCLVKSVEAEIDALSTQLPQNIFNHVLIEMGFRKNWKSEIKLP